MTQIVLKASLNPNQTNSQTIDKRHTDNFIRTVPWINSGL